jgi:ABC-type amino acid transport system permease subunit
VHHGHPNPASDLASPWQFGGLPRSHRLTVALLNRSTAQARRYRRAISHAAADLLRPTGRDRDYHVVGHHGALVVHEGAYLDKAIRAALKTVPEGQTEAVRWLGYGYGYGKTLIKVFLSKVENCNLRSCQNRWMGPHEVIGVPTP